MRFRVLAVLIMACAGAEAQRLSSAGGSPEHQSDLEITSHIFKPVELPAPDVSQLPVPAGFRLQKFAENVGNARIFAISPNGNDLRAGANREDLIKAMHGHVLAMGQLIGLFQRPERPIKP